MFLLSLSVSAILLNPPLNLSQTLSIRASKDDPFVLLFPLGVPFLEGGEDLGQRDVRESMMGRLVVAGGRFGFRFWLVRKVK
eukprot:1323849-Amorphochlora_amoeboformis.AAC.1